MSDDHDKTLREMELVGVTSDESEIEGKTVAWFHYVLNDVKQAIPVPLTRTELKFATSVLIALCVDAGITPPQIMKLVAKLRTQKPEPEKMH